MSKEVIPMISRLMRAMILEDYGEAMDIVKDKDFDPNERTKTWKSPVVSALISVLSGTSGNSKCGPNSRAVFKAILNHEKFNPNERDEEMETVLMHIARVKEFNWLAPFLLDVKGIDLDAKNYAGRTALDIANGINNMVVADLIMAYQIKNPPAGIPHKIVGLRKKKVGTVVTPNVLDKIENAFEDERKHDPFSLYNLIKYFLKGNYDECIRIASNVHFNPNEMDRWDEPGLSSLIYYSQDATVKYDEEKFKEVAAAIINNRLFDVNAIDADCNTVLMVSMGFPRLNWLTKELFKISSSRIDVINDEGEDLKTIAGKCGNETFYKELISRMYETADVVN